MLDGAKNREVILTRTIPTIRPARTAPSFPATTRWHRLRMKKAGALVQDLNSPPYYDLLAGLQRTFDGARKPPLIMLAATITRSRC